MKPQLNHNPVGLAANPSKPGISHKTNELSKPVDSPQPEATGYFGGHRVVQGRQDGQMEAAGVTGWKAEEGGGK